MLAQELEARNFAIEILDRSRMFFELKWIDSRLVVRGKWILGNLHAFWET